MNEHLALTPLCLHGPQMHCPSQSILHTESQRKLSLQTCTVIRASKAKTEIAGADMRLDEGSDGTSARLSGISVGTVRCSQRRTCTSLQNFTSSVEENCRQLRYLHDVRHTLSCGANSSSSRSFVTTSRLFHIQACAQSFDFSP